MNYDLWRFFRLSVLPMQPEKGEGGLRPQRLITH